jgi:hypothetical protein
MDELAPPKSGLLYPQPLPNASMFPSQDFQRAVTILSYAGGKTQAARTPVRRAYAWNRTTNPESV